MENNDTQAPVTSVVSNNHDEVAPDAQPTGTSDEPVDLVSRQVREQDTSHAHPGATKEGSAQEKSLSEPQLGSRGASSADTTPAGPTLTSYVPPVKRFSAVNINKKFLQKNQSSTTASGGTSPSSSSSKQAGVIARPAPQTAHSHSRLVTAKLTATPLSSSPGQGWSRPNSVTPPAPSPANAPGLAGAPTPTVAPVGGHGPPHIAPAGKIIQPQVLKQKQEGPGKPAWRSVQPGTISSGLQTQNEFPTAAEAAKSRLLKHVEAQAAVDISDAQKQAMSETADAFRGVHLDPNAHHWDEMEEEDNDDFLGDVIEFADGRQYTIHVPDGPNVDPKALENSSVNVNSESPVNKADRFVDDFDRSWPKSRPERVITDETAHFDGTTLPETSAELPGHSPVSARDSSQSRVLFNDRLNRMEPIPGGRHGTGSHMHSHGTQSLRDGPGGLSRFQGGRSERDAPPHNAFTSIRKPHEASWNMTHGHEQPPRDFRETKPYSPTSYFHGEYHDRKGRSGWASSASHGGQRPNGRQLESRDPSASRSTVNDTPSVASSDDQGSRHVSSFRDQHRGHFPPSGHTRELDRQLPPHLVHPQSTLPPERPPVGADYERGRHQGPPDVLSQSSADKEDDQPHPALQVQTQSEAAVPKTTASIPPGDVEALRKAFLADSAERAKKRRQQEEEERLKAQERARKKATELEAKIKAAEVAKDVHQSTAKPTMDTVSAAPSADVNKDKPTEAEVLHIIEEAVNAAVPSNVASKGRLGEARAKEATVPKSSFAKAPAHGDDNPSPVSHEAQEQAQPRQTSTTMSDRSESWRARPKPPTLPVQNTNNDISHEPAMSVLPVVHAFEFQADESMEVIDFSDMSRLAGERPSQKSVPEAYPIPSTLARPVASDFFTAPGLANTEKNSWRRASAVSHQADSSAVGNGQGRISHQESPVNSSEVRTSPHKYEDATGPPTSSQTQSRVSVSPTSGVTPQHAQSHNLSSPGVPRFLRSPNTSYREAPLSALDDTMSRIKGALDVMHSVAEHGNKGDSKNVGSSCDMHLAAPVCSPTRPNKWRPPALRPPGVVLDPCRTETFESSHPEPPRSPAPPDRKFTIRLPSVSRHLEPLPKKQINYQKFFGPVRWEILSFDPPVEGMTKKSLSVNDVLFRKPQGPYKMRKYRVSLPKSSATPRPPAGKVSQRVSSDTTSSTPTSKDIANGAFGKARSETSSWRSTSASARVESEGNSQRHAVSVLDVMSRSPPPELSSAANTERLPSVPSVATRLKSSQKSLDVTDVAFYRDVRQYIDNNANVPAVTFTVGSELDDQIDSSPLRKTPVFTAEGAKSSLNSLTESAAPEVKTVSMPVPNLLAAPIILSGNAEPSSSSPTAITQPLNHKGVDEKTIEKPSDPFLTKPPVTPPPPNMSSTWAKLPARVPDPEHLKAVWSQTSNNDSIPTINSLKSIADDLTAVPFTLQEVKSEGGTPPPGPVAPPTRMSASEVTRAFQTVPSGPSNGMPPASIRSSQVPSNLSSPIGSQRALKPPAIGLPPTSMNLNAPRPPYMGYPTSINNHSPSPPTLVYAHVMPSGMAGSPSASPYGQPVWMPVVQQGPQMLRAQSSSPYSPSLMPYHMPGAQNGVFPPSNNMTNPQGSPAAYPSAPPPSQMMISPVLSHASGAPPQAMYPGSPMVMHVAPPGVSPQSRAYPQGAVGMGRGSIPVQNPMTMDPRSHPPPGPAAPVSRFPVHNPGYTPVPPQSFVRPW